VAELIMPNGETSTVHPADRKQGFSLEELYKLLACDCVQIIHLRDGRMMWMDEEGKHKTSQINEKATALLHQAGGVPWDDVVGRVLITIRGEVQ